MSRGMGAWRWKGLVAMGLLAGLLACHPGSPARPSPVLRVEAFDPDAVDASALATSTRTGVHGMVVFGESGAFLYHLPMWHGLHAWQIVLDAALRPEDVRLYQSVGGTRVTFEPEPFALAALQPGVELKGTLYRGHFEQGGTPLPSAEAPAKVTFTVRRLLLVEPLRPGDPKPEAPVYRLLGHEPEWFAVHVARGAPDFDRILRLRERPRVPTTVSATGEITEVPLDILREEYFSTADLGAAQ